jgi:hypothetical protein
MIKKLFLFTIAIVLFSLNSSAQSISMIGDAVSGWSTDVVMSTTDNVNFTLSNFTFSNGGAKFRQNADWGTNWGANAFPSGTANLNGSNIPVTAGIYDVSFNISTRAFSFSAVATGFDAISISGTAGPGLNADVAMLTVDGVNYSLNNCALTAGTLLFRKNNSSAVTWGSSSFPTGTATQGGAAMIVTPGTYDITFNKTTGAYSFVFAQIGIIGSGTAGLWDTDTMMSTSDGVHYSLEGAVLTAGELKFRQNQSWTINWGANTFPVGTATLNGNNIAVVAGTYSVTFNKDTGAFNFSAGYPVISLSSTGNANIDLITLDGVNYYLNNYSIAAGDYLFTQSSPTVNSWGTSAFPSGTATLGGASIPVLAGDYNIKFNKSTGVFSFDYLTISVIGSATPGGWSADTNLTSTDGVNYTLSGLALIVGDLKFRQGNDWTVNWGASSFPGGTAYYNAANIGVTSASTFTVTFNRSTGAFYFYDEVNLQATTPVNLCKGSTASSLSLSVFAVPGSIVKWYTKGGTITKPTYTLIAAGAPKPTTTLVGTKAYYVSQTIGGVEGPKVAIVVNVLDVPAAPTTLTGTAAQGPLVGTSTTATYVTTEVVGATSYLWTAPAGVNIVSGQGTTSITVNFADVATGAGAIGSISVKAVNDNGCPSKAKTLALTKALPAAPAAVKMTNGVTTTAITNFGKYIGYSTELTLTATAVAAASSYVWELPTGVNQVSGGNSNVITVNFLNVPNGVTVLQIGCKSQNGVGVSVTKNTTAVPATLSTAKLLKLTATVPATPATLAGQVGGLCGGNTYSYTMTAAAANASTYFITAPTGSVVKSASNTSNLTNSLVTSDLTFTVQYPADLATLTTKTIVVYSRNAIGDSVLAKTTTVATTMPAVTTVTGTATTFQRCAPQTFSVNTPIAGATYIWTVADGAVITAGTGTSTITVDFSAVSGSALTTKITVKATNTCSVSSAVKSITLATAVCGAKMAEVAVSDVATISMYPNPATSEFNVDLTAVKGGVVSMSIYTLDGAVVSTKDLTVSEGINTMTENIADLASGIYFVQFVNQASSETIVKKLIKR